MNASKQLQVLITAGAEDPHRARQGLEAALAAVALGVQVTVFLTLRGAFWAELRRHKDCVIPGCESIPALLADLVSAGAMLECCASCAQHFTGSCGLDRDLLPGIQLSGLTVMVARTVEGVPTITF
jgi:predicted peroxiredoxin